MVLIDTSAWIFALRKNFHPFIKERIAEVLTNSEVATNGIIVLEILGGAVSEQEYQRLKSRLDALYYMDADRQVWDSASSLAYSLKKKGVSVPYTDIFIAASALKEKALLIHADAHFDSIAKHSGLKTESLVPLAKGR